MWSVKPKGVVMTNLLKCTVAAIASAVLLCSSPASAQTAYDEGLLRLAQYLAAKDSGCVRESDDSVCLVAGEKESSLQALLTFTHFSRQRDGSYQIYGCRASARYVIGRLETGPDIKLDCGSPEASEFVERELDTRPSFLPAAVMNRMTGFFKFIPMGRSQFA